MQQQMRGFLHTVTKDDSGRNDGVQLCRVPVLALDGFGLGADCVLDVLRG